MLDKTFHGKSLHATVIRKKLKELLHCFCDENKKNMVFVTMTIIAFIAKN